MSDKQQLYFGFRLKVLLGNTLSVVGIALLLLSGIGIWHAPHVDISRFYLSDISPHIRGIITHITVVDIPKDTTNHKSYTIAYNFNYTIGSKTYNNTSYGGKDTLRIRDSVEVWYLEHNPAYAVIAYRRNEQYPFDWSQVLITCFLSVLGAIFLMLGVRKGARNIYLMESGGVAHASFTRIEPFMEVGKKEESYVIYLSFVVEGVEYETKFIQSEVPKDINEGRTIYYGLDDPHEHTFREILDFLRK